MQLALATTAQARHGDTVLALGPLDALLLAWLILEGPTPRERLVALLWPDSEPEAARNALRQRLFRLRRQAGVDLVSGSQTLRLADGWQHDLTDAPTLLAHLRDEAGSGELAQWLAQQRQQRASHARLALTQRIDALEAEGRVDDALPVAQALLALDPLSEDAHRRLMRLHYLGGDRAAAVRAFDRCEALLKHELGTRPSADTLALLATVEGSATSAPDRTAPSTAPTPSQGARDARTLPAALMRPPRLVGRDCERVQVVQALTQPGGLVVLGEAGLGKSRLLQAAAEALGALPNATATFHPLRAAGRPGDALAPYATLGRALRVLQQQAATAFEAALAAAPVGALAPLLPELAATAPTTPPVGPAQLATALCAVLQAAQAEGQAQALVLDDLHFADDASLQLLPEMLASMPSLPWVLALRPPEPGSAAAQLLARLSEADALPRLTLAPLDDAALAALVDSLALTGVTGAALAPALRLRSGGNPLFALETLKRAWHDGLLMPGSATGVAELPRPASLDQLIDRSLQALSPEALVLARLAAVAGVDFGVALAEAVLQRPALQLADAWSQLEARQVLRGHAFAHDLVHERVLAGVPEVLARHTHGAVAQWLEGHGGEPARIAAHWEAAGQRERALPSLRQAAERAHQALREEERIAYLLRAAEIAEAHGRAEEGFELLEGAVEAHMNAIREAGGFVLLDRLDALARTPLQRAQALGHRAWYCANLADNDGAIAAGREALALADTLTDTPAPATDTAAVDRLRASLQQRLGTTLAMSGRFDEALPLLRAVRPWMEAHAHTDGAAEFFGNLAAVLDNLGHAEEARPLHARVIAATQALGDASFHATALANQAVSRLNAGDVAGAWPALQRAQQLVTQYDLRGSSAGFIAALQAQAARAQGDFEAALAWCDRAQTLLTAANPAWLPVVWLHQAQTWLDLGQLTRASQALQQAADAPHPARVAARRLMLAGRLQHALGHPGAASEVLDEALARAPATGWPELRLSVRVERATLLSDAQAQTELRAVAADAATLGLAGVRLAAGLRRAERCSGTDASALVAELQDGLSRAEPLPLYRAERWLGLAQAQTQAGDLAAAQATAEAGLAWVADTAARHVPEAFRPTYLAAPLHARLRSIAAGCTPTPAA